MTLKRLQTALPFFLSASLLAGCEQSSFAGEAIGPRPVKSVTATFKQTEAASYPGVVGARIEADHAFRTPGRMVSRKVDVGDLVRKGDVVAEIDPISLGLVVRSAKASLREARAEFANAALVERRKRVLMHKSAASHADYDLAEQQMKSAEANVAKAAAKVDKAREQLGYAQLRAEFDGVVTASFGEAGQTVAAGQPVLRLARLGERDVAVDVPEAQFLSVRLGDRFSIDLQLDSSITTVGTVREIAPQADPNLRTHRLEIAIDAAPEVFRLGAVVKATPLVEAERRTIALPRSAIDHKDGADHVWVVEQSTGAVRLRQVRLDKQAPDDRSARVLFGLREGEQVVVAGVDELKDKQRVKVEQEPRP